MEDGKPPCTTGLQIKLSQIPDGAPPSTGGEAFKMISPVDVRLTSAFSSSFKKPSFVNHGGDHGSSTGAMRQLFLEPSQGKLAGNPDSLNEQMILYQPSYKAPISGNGGVLLASSTSSPLKSDHPGNETRSKWDRSLNNSNMDPRKLKRILSNRLSAQKSRQKKFQYIDEMERKVKALEAEIGLLTPQIAVQEHQVELLKMENTFLNQKLASIEEKNVIKDAVVEQKRDEVRRLKEIYRLQQQQAQVRGMLGWKTGLM